MARPASIQAVQLSLVLCLVLGCETGLISTSDAQNCTPPIIRPRTFRIIEHCNRTVLSDEQKKAIQSPTTKLVVPLLYLTAFLVGLPANVLTLWVLVFHTQKQPSMVLLTNLTVLDLLLLLSLPLRIAYHFNGNNWIFGEALCRLVTALLYGSMYGSVLCLMLISVDRYMGLVHPFRSLTLRSLHTSLILSLAVWVIVLVTMLPLLLTRQSYKLNDPPIVTCHDALPAVTELSLFPYFASIFSIGFLLPLLVILFCHGTVLYTLLTSRQRYVHAACLTLLVLTVFVACFLPSNVLLLVHFLEIKLTGDKRNLYMPYMVSLAVSCFGPSLDPFIYYFVSDDFRAKLHSLLCWYHSGGQNSSTNQVTYSSGNVQPKRTILSSSCGHKGAV